MGSRSEQKWRRSRHFLRVNQIVIGSPQSFLKLLIGKGPYKPKLAQSILPLPSHIIRQWQGPLPIDDLKKDWGLPILKSLDGPRGYDYVLETKIRRGLVFGPTFWLLGMITFAEFKKDNLTCWTLTIMVWCWFITGDENWDSSGLGGGLRYLCNLPRHDRVRGLRNSPRMLIWTHTGPNNWR